MDQHTRYNESNLPTTFLTPPLPAPHPHSKPNWKRNWSIYWIATHWDGNHKGKYNVIADWVARIERKPRLSRQRIEAMLVRQHWLLRNHMVFQLDTLDVAHKAAEPI